MECRKNREAPIQNPTPNRPFLQADLDEFVIQFCRTDGEYGCYVFSWMDPVYEVVDWEEQESHCVTCNT
jgi:hypothetical protein